MSPNNITISLQSNSPWPQYWEAQFKIGKSRPTGMWNNLPNVTQHGEAWLRTMASRLAVNLSASPPWDSGELTLQCRAGSAEVKVKQKLEFVFSPLLSSLVQPESKHLTSLSRRTELIKSLILFLLGHPNSPKSAKPVIYLIWFYAMQQFIFEKFSLLDNGNSEKALLIFWLQVYQGLSQPGPLPTDSIQILFLSLHSLKE